MALIGSVFRQFVTVPSLPSTTSLKGQTVFITGANSGLGLATARQWSLRWTHILLPVLSQHLGAPFPYLPAQCHLEIHHSCVQRARPLPFLLWGKPPNPQASLRSKGTFEANPSHVTRAFQTAALCQLFRAQLESVILAVRTMSTGNAAKASIQESYPSSATKIEVWNLDLQSYELVLAVGKRAATLRRLNIAILNTGVFPFEWKISPDGFETGLLVNHLATPC
jgi:NAD(P)-dependent dehydrogenase (short-subunit alcohol dehydrogenase family)